MCIRYHVWWTSAADPYYRFNVSENTTRTNYYGVADIGVPYLKIDGVLMPSGPSGYWQSIQSRYAADSPIEINLDGIFDPTAGNGMLNIRVVGTDYIDWTNLFVRIALVESNINWRGPNGTTMHNQTMRDMIPDPTGTSITVNLGDTVTLSQVFSCPTQVVADNSQLVVWVQSDMNKEILQAARISLSDITTIGIDDNATLPGSFSLEQNYPNPFNAVTKIMYSLSNESNVRLTVYDLTGRQVVCLQNGKQGTGHYQINWNGADSNGKTVSSGIYFYRLEAGDKSVTKRMALLK
jgi:hypothetical protein